jgi:ADP-L-glycero-D-manno-heptose 6-epimerase
MYGYSKHMFDLWALKHGLYQASPERPIGISDANIVGLKYFNVYGPYEDHKGDMRSVVSKSYEQIRRDGVVRLFKSYRPEYKDGEQMRDFIYVKDAVDVTLHFALQPPDAPGGLFNCGTGKARTWVDLATAVFSAMNLPAKIEFIEMPQQLQGKYQYFTQASEAKLRAAGYTKPFTSLEDGVREYITGYYLPRES